MIRQIALITIFVSVLLIGGAYALAFLPGDVTDWSAWLMVIGVSALMVATMVLGVVRAGRVGRLWVPLALVLIILLGGFGAALLLPAEGVAATTFWFGLPPRAALVVYGVGLLPLLLLPVAYALTFDATTLREPDLELVRRLLRERASPRACTEAAEVDAAVGSGAGEVIETGIESSAP